MINDSFEIDERILILGSSKISCDYYNNLAISISEAIKEGSRASNPFDTSVFIQSIKGNPNKDELIYKRIIRLIDLAKVVIVDISEASTGVGVEVGYLISTLRTHKKRVYFISQNSKKPSPHIMGMYKTYVGKYPHVYFYKEQDSMFDALSDVVHEFVIERK